MYNPTIKNYPPAVVVGLNDASLSIVRSLGRRGIPVIGLYYKGTRDYYTISKYLKMTLEIPNDDSLAKVLVDDISRRFTVRPVLFCGTDESVLIVSKYKKELKKNFNFVVPPYDVTTNLISKKKFHKFALKNAISAPQTRFISGSDDIDNVIQEISFPCIIKPEYKNETWYKKVPYQYKVLHAESKENFINLIEQYGLRDDPLVIQEWIDGDDLALYFCLMYISRNNQPLAICIGRKLRQHPHLAGTLSVAETKWVKEIAEDSLKLLKVSGCTGFCSVEFKYSKRDGKFYVIEPTIGRVDSQEGLSVKAGIDIPYIAYLDALQRDVKPQTYFLENIKWIDESLMYYTVQEIFRNTLSIRELLSLVKGKKFYSLWSIDDPVPFLVFIKEKIKNNIERIRKSTR